MIKAAAFFVFISITTSLFSVIQSAEPPKPITCAQSLGGGSPNAQANWDIPQIRWIFDVNRTLLEQAYNILIDGRSWTHSDNAFRNNGMGQSILFILQYLFESKGFQVRKFNQKLDGNYVWYSHEFLIVKYLEREYIVDPGFRPMLKTLYIDDAKFPQGDLLIVPIESIGDWVNFLVSEVHEEKRRTPESANRARSTDEFTDSDDKIRIYGRDDQAIAAYLRKIWTPSSNQEPDEAPSLAELIARYKRREFNRITLRHENIIKLLILYGLVEMPAN